MIRFAWIAAVLFVAPLGAQQPAEAPPQIVTSGRAQAVIPPDEAQVSVAVETTASTASAAASRNASRMNAVRQALIALGIPAANITTANFSVVPNMVTRDGKSRQEGYAAANEVIVRTQVLDQVGAIIDAALQGGAERIGYVAFSSTRIAQARRTALSEAVTQARADAEAMAVAAGGTLGTLLDMSTTNGGPPMSLRIRGASSYAAATTVTPGDISVDVSVTARWRFVPR